MASTAGEGTSYGGAGSGGGGGGAGGKFRKRPFRRPQTTPYDRPLPLALRNPKGANNGWLSKLLVDPASKLISASAHLFFSSVFRKRLPPPPPPPPPPPEANQESRDRFQEAVLDNPPGVQRPVVNDGGKPTNSSDTGELSQLEQILKQKTFTRSEIDRLTELLRSRTVDLPHGDDDKRIELNFPQPLSAAGRAHEFTSSPMQENGMEIEGHKFRGRISTPIVSSQVREEDVAAPAELAKAYMGSKPSKLSPSMFGLRSPALKEDASVVNTVPFAPKSPAMSLVPKPAARLGVTENGFLTPRSRGRSAIYNMARTPYSRVHSTATQKNMGSTYDGYGGPPPSSSQFPWEHEGQYSSKQSALKRRSFVLEDNIGTVGPIRRLRQKTNLSTPTRLSLQASESPISSYGTGVGPDAANRLSSAHKLPLLDEHRISKTGEDEDNNMPSTSYTPVPSKSTEMATKILQQLDKLVPKEKSSEGKVVAAREKSTSKLASKMLNGQALRSRKDVDSPNILSNAVDTRNLKDMRTTTLFDAEDTSSQKQNKVENGPKSIIVGSNTLAPAGISNATVLVEEAAPGFKTAGPVSTQRFTQPSQNKWGFQMSAHEDFLELDDEILSNAASTTSAEGKRKLETPVVESNVFSSEAVMVGKTSAVSDSKTHASPVVEKSTDLEASDVTVVGERKSGFTFPTAPASSTTFQLVAANQSTSAFDQIVPPKGPNAERPLFSFNSKSDGEFPHSFSYSSSVTESSVLNSTAPLESNPESSNSFANVAGAGATDSVQEIPVSDKCDNKDLQKSGDTVAKSEVFDISTSTSASNIFSFGAPAKSSGLNGSLGSSSSVFPSPSPVLASGNLKNQAFANSFTSVAPSTTANGTSSDSSQSASAAAAPSFPAASIFKFGSTSVVPTYSVSTVLTTSSAGTMDLKAKTENETTTGNLTSSLFGGTSLAVASTGSSIFGFSASATSSTANNLSQGSPFGTSSGSLINKQASPAGTGVAPISQSMPTMFGSSGSAPLSVVPTITQSMPIMFGSSGSAPLSGAMENTSFSSSSSLFGSSTSGVPVFCSSTSGSSVFGLSTPKVIGSSSGFGLSTSASSSVTNSISSSGATSSLFGSSWQPTKSSIFSSNTESASTGFSFNASSISAAATNSTPVVFGAPGASSGPIFSFASPAAAASSSQTQPVFGSSVPVFQAAAPGNGDQMEDSMAEDNLIQASTPTGPVFGQIPMSTPSPGFMFGSTAPSVGNPFQFGSQQNQSTLQNPPPFQPSGSLDFSAGGGSFSLGSAGDDKANRRIVRVKHKSRRR